MDFPGGKVMFVPELRFLAESPGERISCYRVLDDDGQTISGSSFQEVAILKLDEQYLKSTAFFC